MNWFRKLHLSDSGFNIVTALVFTLINALFIQRCWRIIAPDSFHTWGFAASIPLVLFCGWLAVFSLINLPGLRKFIVPLLLVGCAAANYFMYSYGAVIDTNMMVNVFETNSQEATALITPQLLLCIGLMGFIPAVIIGAVKIRSGHWWYAIMARALCVFGAILIILLAAALFYKDYASLFRNNKGIVKMVTPANYVSAVSSYSKQRWFAGDRTLIKIGEDAHKGPIISAQDKKTVVILVVGEASRAENYSLNGYSRETNPELKKRGVINFAHASSCGTETAVSVPCMFSGMGRKNYDADLASHREGLLDVMAHAGINLLWRENDGGCKGACDRIPHTDMTQWKLADLCQKGSCLDGVQLNRLDEVLDGVKQDSVIVLHLMGSHGPAYYRRYPDQFRRFTPTCDSNQIQDCDRQALINTYDNTILYTDSILSQTIDKLKARSGNLNTALMYLSDHGESLGENGIYLHGTPYMIAPEAQTHIPLLFWLSDSYARNYQVDPGCLQQQGVSAQVSQDNLFSTLLGMMNVKTNLYQQKMDIFSTCRKA